MLAKNTQSPEQHASTDLILSELKERFPGRLFIYRTEFRELFDISSASERRMIQQGFMPCIIGVAGEEGRRGRILLVELAKWLANGGSRAFYSKDMESEPPITAKRGRPIGSRNKPKNIGVFSSVPKM